VLPSGEARGDEVGELVTRPEMDEMTADLRRRYDYVLFDTPPMNVVAETGMIGRSVGEALLVVRMNKTRRESVEKAIRLLHSANVKLAGLVLTHRTYQIPEYLYRYT
jgi:Mrp family chromosome partitioning ATPase